MDKSVVSEKLLPTNSVVDEIYKKYVDSITMNGHHTEGIKGSNINSKQVEIVICLHIFDVPHKDISECTGIKQTIVSSIANRGGYRGMKVCFQESKRKSLGKMLFTYNEFLLQEYVSALPESITKVISKPMNKDKLVKVSKILKSEYYL